MNSFKLTLTIPFFAVILPVSIFAANSYTGVSGYPQTLNTVDASAGSSDLSGFTSAVTSAFDNDTGATLVFDDNTLVFTEGEVTFGTSAAYKLSINSSTSMQTVGNGGSFAPLTGVGVTPETDSVYGYTLTLGDITDLGTDTVVSGVGVTRVGFTVLSRSSAYYPLEVTALATFDDASTATLSATIASSDGGDNTFYEFSALAGKTISSIALSSDHVGAGDARIAIDNFGFLTSIPEPQTYAMLFGLVALASIGLRRR